MSCRLVTSLPSVGAICDVLNCYRRTVVVRDSNKSYKEVTLQIKGSFSC